VTELDLTAQPMAASPVMATSCGAMAPRQARIESVLASQTTSLWRMVTLPGVLSASCVMWVSLARFSCTRKRTLFVIPRCKRRGLGALMSSVATRMCASLASALASRTVALPCRYGCSASQPMSVLLFVTRFECVSQECVSGTDEFPYSCDMSSSTGCQVQVRPEGALCRKGGNECELPGRCNGVLHSCPLSEVLPGIIESDANKEVSLIVLYKLRDEVWF